MKLELATASDSPALVELFKEFPMKGLVELKVDRLQDFFGPYKIQADQWKTYILRDEKAEIHGSASIVFRDTCFDKKLTRIATASDLRVKPHRRAILEWAHHFLPVINKEIEENQVSSIFSYMNLSDPTALNTFVRPRAMRRAMPRYYLYRKFNLVSLHGRYPWASQPVRTVKIRRGCSATFDSLLEYIIRRSQYRPFASVWDEASFKAKMNRLRGQKLEDFIIAFDSLDNVVGCLAPWTGSDIQDYIPMSYSLVGHNFRQYLKFLWLFGITRRLTKPVVSTGLEQKLQFSYLTNVFADNEDVFESLVHTAYDDVGPNNFLLYAHTEQDYRLLPPPSWIGATYPYALYSVVPPEKPMPDFLHPSISLNPEIEAFTVI